MDDFRIENREHSRFATLIHMMEKSDSIDLRIACITFVNYLTNTSEIEDRVAIRNDFLRLNILQLSKRIIENGDDIDPTNLSKFSTQVEVFEQIMTEDAASFNYEDLDLTNPETLFQRICQNVSIMGADNSLLSVLHRLVAVPSDNVIGAGMWDLFIKTVDRILTMNTSKALLTDKIIKYEEITKIVAEANRLSNASSIIKELEATIARQKSKLSDMEKQYEELKKKSAEDMKKELETQLKKGVDKARAEIKDEMEDQISALNRNIFDLKASLQRTESEKERFMAAASAAESAAAQAIAAANAARVMAASAPPGVTPGPPPPPPMVGGVPRKCIHCSESL
jgi:hypothetical protein